MNVIAKKLLVWSLAAGLMVITLAQVNALPLKMKNGNTIDVKLISAQDDKILLQRGTIQMTVPKDRFEEPQDEWISMAETALMSGDTAEALDYSSQILIWDPLHVKAQKITDDIKAAQDMDVKRNAAMKEEEEAMARYNEERAKAESSVKKMLEEESRKPSRVFENVRKTYQVLNAYTINGKVVQEISTKDTTINVEIPILMAGLRPNRGSLSMKMNGLEVQVFQNPDTTLIYMPVQKQYFRIPTANLSQVKDNLRSSPLFNIGFENYENLISQASTVTYLRDEEIVFDNTTASCYVYDIPVVSNPAMEKIMSISDHQLWVNKTSNLVLQETQTIQLKAVADVTVKQIMTYGSLNTKVSLTPTDFGFVPPKDATAMDMAKLLQGMTSMMGGVK